MPKKLKLDLKGLKIKSFVTSLEDGDKTNIKGGTSITCYPCSYACPSSPAQTCPTCAMYTCTNCTADSCINCTFSCQGCDTFTECATCPEGTCVCD